MSRTGLWMLFAVFAVTACATPSQPSATNDQAAGILVQPGREFQLAIGETARIYGTSSRIVFLSVLEDSRCPADVQCVWAGNAKVVLTLSTQGMPDRPLSVNTAVDPRTATVAGSILRVTGLSPDPRSGAAIPANGYVARFELTAM